MNVQQQPKPSNTKRKVKEFPSELACVRGGDRSKFGMALEIDSNPKSKNFGAEFLVVQTVKVTVNNNETLFDLKTLILDHLRQLCKNVGVVNCGSSNKFDCRKALATFIKRQDMKGLSASAAAARLTSTIIRAVNVILSDKFRHDFLCVNDRKRRRRDHEERNNFRNFWYQATRAHNMVADRPSDIVNVSPTQKAIGVEQEQEQELDGNANNCIDFTRLVHCEGDPHLAHLLTDGSLNLMEVEQFDTLAFRKKILDLFTIRRCIKEDMAVSGTHDNDDAWNFIEGAMTKTPGFTKVAVYYFYKQCELVEEIDSNFQPFLGSMIGDTISLNSSDSEYDNENEEDDSSAKATSSSVAASTTSSSRKRKHHQLEQVKGEETSASLKMLLEQGKLTLQLMDEAAKREKLRFEREAKNLEEATNREKLRFEREGKNLEEAANWERLRFELDTKKDKFFARLAVAKAMNDMEELEKLKREASEMP